MSKAFSRRRFLTAAAALAGGAAVLAAYKYKPLSALTTAEPSARLPYYPPALLGLRGNHEGSQTFTHALAIHEKVFTLPEKAEETYDLVVVGAGVSGLSAAYRFLQKQPEAKILIVDNHDDFGGHAKRTEFTVNNQTVITYGGSESLDSPKNNFSEEVHFLLKDLGVDYVRLGEHFQQDLYHGKWKLNSGILFNQATFGQDKLVVLNDNEELNADNADSIENFPISEEAKRALTLLYTEPSDYLSGKSKTEKHDFAETTSYYDFLANTVKLPEEALSFLSDLSSDYWGHTIRAVSVSEALESGYPGVSELGLEEDESEEEPYIYHFPDGNASIARLLVRKLIPGAISGSTMEDIVTAKADYSMLDNPENQVRLRLNTTAIRIDNQADSVSVYYMTQGQKQLHQIQARKCIFAGHGALAPHIIPSMPEEQKTAMKSNVKIPMLYAKVALKNARAFQKLGIFKLYMPTSAYCLLQLDDPVNIGDYQHAATADDPIVVHMSGIPAVREGDTAREMYRSGRRLLNTKNYEQLEQEALGILRTLFDMAGENLDETLAGIAIHRWAHGYSYEQVGLWDSDEEAEAATALMRRPVGNIHMAGSDVAWMPYLQNAIGEGLRAAHEAAA